MVRNGISDSKRALYNACRCELVDKITVIIKAHLQNDLVPPILSIGDFRLRSLRLGDEVAWHAYLAEPCVIEHTSFPQIDLDTVRTWVARHIEEYATGSSCRWALADSRDDLIGTCGFSNWSLTHAHAELVYDLSPGYWSHGLMRRAVDAVLEWAFTTVKFHRVHAYVMTSNNRSIALLDRCGFIREGMLHHYRIARGEPRDFYVYAKISTSPLKNQQLASGAQTMRDDNASSE